MALLLSLALSASAFAESPWWHLSSGTRPAYLHAGAGQNELQEIIAHPQGEIASFELSVNKESLGIFVSEPSGAELGFPPPTVANIQSALESPSAYGPGNVIVSGGPVETAPLIITTINARGGQVVAPIEVGEVGIGTAEGKIRTPGSSDGEIYLTAENVGDANAEGAKAKVQLKDVLPKGLKATAIAATKPHKEGDFHNREPLSCTLATLSCTLSEALAPYDQVEMRISVEVKPGATSGELNEFSISGGGAPPTAVKRPITISAAPVPFGVESYEMGAEEEGGAPSTQAGAHPFQLNTTIALNQLADLNPLVTPPEYRPEVTPAALAKDLSFKLPPGLIGNPTSIPQCTTAQFFETVEGKENKCPANTALGVAVATVHEPDDIGTVTVTEPIFNLEPRVGEPARFGFYVVIANSPVFIDTSVRTGSDYGVTASVQNITQTAAFLSSEVTFWGVPGDSRHDKQRGWGCLYEARGATVNQPCTPAEEQHPPPFLSLPSSCAEALSTSVQGDPWVQPANVFDFPGKFDPSTPLGGCNRLQFAPELKVTADGQEASRPTGLSVDVHVPQEVNANAQGLASSNLKSITVAFPEGVTVNPSAADGLEACSQAQVGLLGGLGSEGESLFTATLPEAFCSDASKIGTVKIKSPLLPPAQALEGALYLATPAPNGEAGKNPFNTLLAMYIIAKDPISGVLVKLPGSASLDPSSGRITATFANNPQLPFEDAEIHLLSGERAPLSMPASCGLKTSEATFTPWSGGAPVKSSSSFQLTSGPHGSPCPGASLPFAPTLSAGTTGIDAGSFSPLSTTINRPDGNQAIQSVALHMPPGLSGVLKGVELCPEAQANAGSCGPGSQIGKTTVSVGLGTDPFSVTGGRVYLSEKYAGAPFGLSIVTPAVAGPFDLGNVIVRAKVEVDPHSAALSVSTDTSGPYAIPHILDGIPLQIQHVNVTVDRPGFTFNPTNCAPQSITGTIQSAEGASAPLESSFQAANCAKLKFAPSFSLSTAGKTTKANGASLKVKLSYPNAPAGTYANLARVKVSLPKELPSRLSTLQKACLAAVFDANPANCPKESIVGQAKVITPLLPVALMGSAYFVSHGGEAFPDLTILLKGYGITIELVGSTQIKHGVTTNTFKSTPDVPFSSFELSLPQQKYSALTANTNLCKAKLTMPTEFIAQNGAVLNRQTKVAVSGCAKPLSKRQQLAKAIRACKKRHAAKRSACEAQAHRRFGAKKAAKKAGRARR